MAGRLRPSEASRYYTGRMSTGLIWQTTTTNSEETTSLGGLLGRNLEPPAVIELLADLGGGKTTFATGLAKGLGSNDRVSSPTFTLSRIYKTKSGEIHHFDFYRLNEPGIIADQLAESLADPKVVTVVEWSKIVRDVLPEDRLVIELAPLADNPDGRQVTIRYPELMANVIKKVATVWEEVEP